MLVSCAIPVKNSSTKSPKPREPKSLVELTDLPQLYSNKVRICLRVTAFLPLRLNVLLSDED